MRRKQCEINDFNQIERILDVATIGRMATLGVDGYPYITPVNFVYFKRNIYFHSAPAGEKLENLTRSPNVCFEVDIPLACPDSGFDPDGGACRLHQFYHCVIIRGYASLVQDDYLKAECLNALVGKHERRAYDGYVTLKTPGLAACVVVEIKPVTVTGKTDLWQYKPLDVRMRLAQYLSDRGAPGDLETVASIRS
jgi:nitroimidazol reductase NimA-like FMN-containing flavoprotein (pyridoxamine 5'-phosphate oxidase superfamily)